MLVEQKLPLDVDARRTTSSTIRPSATRLVRVFEQGLRPPVGYVLPLLVWRRATSAAAGVTERWGFARGQLFLMPGDSPPACGCRSAAAEIRHSIIRDVLPRDPFAEHRPLPRAAGAHPQRKAVTLRPAPVPPPTAPARC